VEAISTAAKAVFDLEEQLGEINVKDLTTASRDFAPTARDAILDRFARCHESPRSPC